MLALLVGLLLVPSTAGAAQSVRSEFFGIVQAGINPSKLDNTDLTAMKATKVHAVRYLFDWKSVQATSADSYNWGQQDKFIGRLASHGIRAVPTIWGNPTWVSGPDFAPPLATAQDKLAWQNFLKAVVSHYGPGGIYWNNGYRDTYGASATPLPIESYQIWNEPNLKKYWIPYPDPKKYGELVRLSSTAIKSVDPKAQIVLGGMPGYPDTGVQAWEFLKLFYNKTPGAKSYFDAAALHPYSGTLNGVSQQVTKLRTVMKNQGDAATPLWISEIAWGSAPPDSRGINKGPTGQAKMLKDAYNLFLSHRATWNVQRLFWYHWRDPKHSQASCTFCSSAALLNFNRTKKPAYAAFKGFAADSTAPRATITAGPTGVTHDRTPTFAFKSSQIGSTFLCRFDSKAFGACSSPYTPKVGLANGTHRFSVKAIDAAGNVSPIVSRAFTVAP